MKTNHIGFIGGGRVVRIFLEGWSRAGLSPEDRDIVVSDTDSGVLDDLAARFPGVRVTEDNRESASADLVVLAVHPPALGETAAGIASELRPESLVVSLAPKFTLAKLTGLLGGFERLSRCIPNAPSLVGRGFNPVAHGPGVTDSDRAALADLLDPLGQSPEVPESTLEAYAVLSAMGPTYFWFQWQTLRDLGTDFGLSRKDADVALSAMLNGAAATLFDSGLEPTDVMDLIPVKPLADFEKTLVDTMQARLGAIHEKIRP